MAQITPDTFDPLRRFVSVRLQQGVPIVDADWNEQDDVRQFEMRAHTRWFVGDGVPYGSDAFRITALAAPAANNILINAGVPPAAPGENAMTVGLRHVGRCLVDGKEAAIAENIRFRAQALHVSQAGAANLATRWATSTIAEMPVLDGTICLYLDVWDRLVRPDELPALVFPEIGTESCARIRREWAVRARTGTTAPAAGDADFVVGHAYYALARINRVAADPIVYPGQITDLRERQLLTPPATMITDMLGTTPERYRRGLDRPAVSLRTALNALMRGELPSSDDQVIAPDAASDFQSRAVLVDDDNGYFFWHSNRVGAINQVFATSWPHANAAVAAGPPVQVTAVPAAPGATTPSIALLPTSPAPTFFVAYRALNDIRFKVATSLAALNAAPENPVAAQAETERNPLVLRAGSIVTVFWYWDGPGITDRIRYRRRQYDATWSEGAATWLDPETVDLSTIRPAAPTIEPGSMHGVADGAGRLWLAFTTSTNNITVCRLTAATGAIDNWANFQFDSGGNDAEPFLLIDGPNRVWLFWRSPAGVHSAMHDGLTDTWGPIALIPGTAPAVGQDSERPTAVREADGGIWLLWAFGPSVDTDVWALRRNPATGGWGAPRQITASPGENDFPLAIAGNGVLRVFFRSNRAGQFDNYTKTVVTSI